MKKLITFLIIAFLLSSCASSKYYKGCDGKRKFRTNMH